MKRRTAILCVLATGVAFGCAHWIEVRSEPNPLATGAFLQSTSRAKLILETVDGVRNGDPLVVSSVFRARFAAAMRRPGLFGGVYDPSAVDDESGESARARLRVTEEAGGRVGVAMVKGALIGLSLFTLAPVLPLRYDETESLQLEIRLPNGQRRGFTVSTSASVYFRIFGDAEHAAADLDELVTNKNLEGLVSRVGADPAIRSFLDREP